MTFSTAACTYCIHLAIITQYKRMANRHLAMHTALFDLGAYRTDRLRPGRPTFVQVNVCATTLPREGRAKPDC